MDLPFRDRAAAGRWLAAELATRHLGEETTILALARGGVPVGAAVADALHLPLDVVVVRKLGVPWQPELAMGALAGRTCFLEDQFIAALDIAQPELDGVIARESREMERREKLYRHGQPEPDLQNRTVVLVDDGLATGSTMVAAVRDITTRRPRKRIVAVPVGAREACERLRKEVDECICLTFPNPFVAVGACYRDFRQVTDGEVQRLLQQNRERIGPNKPAKPVL